MSDELNPVRVMIGGPSGCVGYSQEELRVLRGILAKNRSERTLIVHRAMRIMCQAMINDPQGGYPGSLSDLNIASKSVESSSGEPVISESPTVQAGVQQQSVGDEGDDWLLAASAKDAEGAERVITTVVGEPEPEGYIERDKGKQIASQFIA